MRTAKVAASPEGYVKAHPFCVNNQMTMSGMRHRQYVRADCRALSPPWLNSLGCNGSIYAGSEKIRQFRPLGVQIFLLEQEDNGNLAEAVKMRN